MNENNNKSLPDLENEPMHMPDGVVRKFSEVEESVANGPILILLVALLLAVLGGMFYWFTMLDNDTPVIIPSSLRPTAEENNEPESTTAEAQVESMGIVSTSDEIPAIEADVESTNLDSLESELDAIEAELDAALQTDAAAETPIE